MQPRKYRSPLAIAGFILLFCGLAVAGAIWLLRAEPTSTFYLFTGSGLAFIAINPYILRARSSELWQGLIIGAAAASICWFFFT